MLMEICHVVVSFVKIGQVKAYFVYGQGDSPLVLSMGEVLCKRLTYDAVEHWDVS